MQIERCKLHVMIWLNLRLANGANNLSLAPPRLTRVEF